MVMKIVYYAIMVYMAMFIPMTLLLVIAAIMEKDYKRKSMYYGIPSHWQIIRKEFRAIMHEYYQWLLNKEFIRGYEFSQAQLAIEKQQKERFLNLKAWIRLKIIQEAAEDIQVFLNSYNEAIQKKVSKEEMSTLYSRFWLLMNTHPNFYEIYLDEGHPNYDVSHPNLDVLVDVLKNYVSEVDLLP